MNEKNMAYVRMLEEENKQLKREKKALLNDLRSADKECEFCGEAKNAMAYCETDCKLCKNKCKCYQCRNNEQWWWRGIVKENT